MNKVTLFFLIFIIVISLSIPKPSEVFGSSGDAKEVGYLIGAGIFVVYIGVMGLVKYVTGKSTEEQVMILNNQPNHEFLLENTEKFMEPIGKKNKTIPLFSIQIPF